jgi:acyl carrier protein
MSDGVQRRVSRVLAAVFGVSRESVDAATDQSSIESWDSLSHIHLVTALESEFSLSFTPEEVLEMTSVRAICDVVRAKGAPDA